MGRLGWGGGGRPRGVVSRSVVPFRLLMYGCAEACAPVDLVCWLWGVKRAWLRSGVAGYQCGC